MARHIPRLFCPTPLHSGMRILLPEETAHHLVHVLRLKPGAALLLFDGHGGEFEATVLAAAKNRVEAEIGVRHEVHRESPLRVTLVQGISRGERMDYTIQKAVELGVTAIQPVETLRSVMKLEGERAERRHRHWQEVARSAAEQCGRDRVPAVSPIQPLADWLNRRDRPLHGYVLAPAAGMKLRDLESREGLGLLVGPEGGLEEAEIAQAESAGFIPLQLGPRILRTETAAVACLAAMQALWGDF